MLIKIYVLNSITISISTIFDESHPLTGNNAKVSMILEELHYLIAYTRTTMEFLINYKAKR